MPHPAPNLFVIGSMKSGTTYLSRLLEAHPAVFMCPVKEPCYFADPRALKSVWQARWRDGHWRSLDHYLSLFAAHRIYTLTLESLVAQPREQYRALCSWLGIDPDFEPGHFGERMNETPEDIEKVRGLGILHRLRCSGTYGSMRSLVPKSVRKLGSRLAAKPFKLSPMSVDEVVQYLRLTQQKQTEELSDLLGREFPEWKTLYGATKSDLVSSRRGMTVPRLIPRLKGETNIRAAASLVGRSSLPSAFSNNGFLLLSQALTNTSAPRVTE